jgi:hypothetical protein
VHRHQQSGRYIYRINGLGNGSCHCQPDVRDQVTVVLMLVVKWLLILLGTAVLSSFVLLCVVMFLDYHVDKIQGKDNDQ